MEEETKTSNIGVMWHIRHVTKRAKVEWKPTVERQSGSEGNVPGLITKYRTIELLMWTYVPKFRTVLKYGPQLLSILVFWCGPSKKTAAVTVLT